MSFVKCALWSFPPLVVGWVSRWGAHMWVSWVWSVPSWGAGDGGGWGWGGRCPQGEHLLTLPYSFSPSPHLPQLHAAGICPPLGNGAVTRAGCSPQRLDLIYLPCLQLTSMSTVGLSFISLKFCMFYEGLFPSTLCSGEAFNLSKKSDCIKICLCNIHFYLHGKFYFHWTPDDAGLIDIAVMELACQIGVTLRSWHNQIAGSIKPKIRSCWSLHNPLLLPSHTFVFLQHLQ